MATFAKSGFNAASYATFRPAYPHAIFTTLLSYHRPPSNLALDLGCGHGTVSRSLAPSFTRIIGTDPSPSMIAQAKATSTGKGYSNISFLQKSAEDLDFVEDGTVDCVVAGQAAHWFDYAKVWPALARKVRQGGTVVWFGYKDNVFVDFPAASRVLDHYCYGPGKELMGMYWEQPGRNILRDKYEDILPPDENWEDVQRITYEPGLNGKGSGDGEVLMAKKLKLGEMEGYGRTFSAYLNWCQAHPDQKPLEEGGKGDVIDEMFEKMLEVQPEWRQENWRDIEVECEWGSVILLARRK